MCFARRRSPSGSPRTRALTDAERFHQAARLVRASEQKRAPPGNAKAAEQWLQAFVAPTGLTVDQLTQVSSGALTHGKESFNHLLVGYNEIATAENQAMNQIWSGKLSPADGLKQAQAQVGAVLSKQT